ncbi:RNA-guided endonuclease InsQ/TnpB family protein [Nostoc sp.]|uniref:RNA-guided endonuclease InsQ/TnpB family protein n=1 Tax=Nostoc sp. TaxID=1180 RepID=UPI002FFCDD35
MSITRRITFRLYPSPSQAKTLSYWRRLHKDLYNSAIANRKNQYKHFKKSVDYYEQQNCLPEFKEVWYEYKQLGSHALQATLKRVDMAFQRFFKRLGGYPKFKSIRHYSGWTYPCIAGWKALTNGKNGQLELSNLGKIQMRGSARTWGKPTTCTIVNRQGNWYASITVQCVPVRETGVNAIGLDFGCLTAVACSDGTVVENPRPKAATQTKIKIASKSKRRKTKPDFKKKIKASNRWKKAHKKVAKLQRKVGAQRQDWVHKVAAEIVSLNSLVATEKLNIKAMTHKAKSGSKRKAQKTGLNRSILDVGMGGLRSTIEYKLAEAGGIFVEVPTQKVKPSQTCPQCGTQKKKELSERIHNCPCGFTSDRDVAAAMVMLNWAMGTGTDLIKRGSDGSTSTHCGGFKQLAELKRQKPRPSS